MSAPKLYPDDLKHWALEPHYSRHVSAMTSEGLHDKADIAEQLAWRDKWIVKLQDEIAALTHTNPSEPQGAPRRKPCCECRKQPPCSCACHDER